VIDHPGKLIVKSKTENLSSIRDFVSNYAQEAGIDQEIIEKIILAVDEACTNIMKHAYKTFPDGEIIIKVKFDKHKFTIVIRDFGNSFEADKIPDPDLKKYYNEKRIGGLGMYLMRTLMDEVQYFTVPGKYNQVLLSKNINSSGH
jgi:serine/threonine-protein kinase RsbW